MAKPHQVRGRITGGHDDCIEFWEGLKAFAETNGWELVFHEGPVGFGDMGPIQKISWGFQQKQAKHP